MLNKDLPPALEAMLNILLDSNNELSAWYVDSEHFNGQTLLTLHFSTPPKPGEEGAEQGAADANITYGGPVVSGGGNNNNSHIPIRALSGVMIRHLPLALLKETDDQWSQTDDSHTTDDQGSHTDVGTVQTKYDESEDLAHRSVSYDYETGVSSHEARSSGVSSDISDEEDLEEEEDSDFAVTCQCCKREITNVFRGGPQWYRCTHCPVEEICGDCYSKGDNKHKKHHDQIHAFRMELDDPDSTFCYSCGYEFKNDVEILIQCEKCEDYCLCEDCHSEGMHAKHADTFKEMLVEDYNSLFRINPQ